MPKLSKKKTISKRPTYRHDKCGNSFHLQNHPKKRGTTLRKILTEQLLAWNIPVNNETSQMMICTSCRLRPISSTTKKENDNEDPGHQMETVSSEEHLSPTDEMNPTTSEGSDSGELTKGDKKLFSSVVAGVNNGLSFVGVSPIEMKKFAQRKYAADKIDSISNALRKHIFNGNDEDSGNQDNEDDDESYLLEVIQEKFSSTTDRTKQIKILTIVHGWPYSKIKKHFPNATRHMIEVAKKIALEKGILEEPNPKSHPSLEDSVIHKVMDFYQSDEYSRVMPGKKDYVSVKIDGIRNHVQKRLLLLNLRELYCAFKNINPEIECSFSKFASLRPKQCILAGASGTHSVCVCAIHENVKLLIDGVNLQRLTANREQPIKTYHDCLNEMICNPATTDCYMETCSKCPGTDHLMRYLENTFEENYIDHVTYKQWTSVDRSTLQTVVTATDEFLDILAESLKKVLRHSFLVRQQNEFFNSKKESLKPHECIVICDFSENYAFVIQNAIQGFHWNNDQATIHPTAIYYRDEQDNIVKMKSLVSISECLHHDTIAVHMFQSKIIQFIKQNVPRVKRIIYFSDGASAQYKNRKNFINVTHHMEDFEIAAEWHFFPMSHGKGPCDGLGGTLKRLAARASLQRIDNPIRTPLELFNWAKEALPNINCEYFTNQQYELEEKQLAARFQKSKTVKGTLSYHSIVPVTIRTLHVKPFSLFHKSTIVQIMK